MLPGRTRSIALRWFLPLLVASAVLNQQTSWALLLAGQLASVVGMIGAIVIVAHSFRGARWPALLSALVVALRVARLFPAGAGLVTPYTLAVSVLFAVAGGVMAIQTPRLLATQTVVLCAASVPLMWLQLVGAGEWTQWLRTDVNRLVVDTSPVRTFLVPPEAVVINALQVRPAGFFPSNNTLSIVLMFAIGLHLTDPRRRELSWRDIAICGAAVLSMAKIVLLTFGCVAAWATVSADRSRRQHALAASALFAVLLVGYAVAFPGVFDYNLSPSRVVLNFRYRAADLAMATGIAPLEAWARAQPSEIVETAEDPQARQSGYAQLAPYLPLLLAGALFGLVPYRRGFRTVWARRPDLARQSLATMIVVALVPLVTSYVASVIFGLMLGVALLPALVALGPRYRTLLDASTGFRGYTGRSRDDQGRAHLPTA